MEPRSTPLQVRRTTLTPAARRTIAARHAAPYTARSVHVQGEQLRTTGSGLAIQRERVAIPSAHDANGNGATPESKPAAHADMLRRRFATRRDPLQTSYLRPALQGIAAPA